MILMVISLALLIWSLTFLKIKGLESLDVALAILIYLVMAVVLELLAVEIRQYGYASLSFCVYFALMVKYNFPVVVAIAAIAVAAREIFVNRQVLFFRLADFASSIINITVAGIVFSVVNQGAPFLSTWNILGMIAGAVSYYGMDFLLSTTVVGLFDDDTRHEFNVIRSKVMAFNIALAPLGALLIIAYDKSPWFTFLILLPLFALRKSLEYGVKEIVIANQQELELMADELKSEVEGSKEQNRELTSELQKKVDELSILFETGHSLGTSVNLESTLEIIVSMIRKMVTYQSCVIFLVEKGILVAAKSVTPYRDILEYSTLLKLEETIVNMVVQNKKPMLITDMQSMSDQRIFKDEKSVICVPLVVKNEIVGLIYLGATRPGSYDEDHLHLLSILGNAASNAISTSQLYEQLADRHKEIQTINSRLEAEYKRSIDLVNLGQDLGSSLNLDETLRIIVRGMKDMFDYQSGAVFLVREDKKGKSFVSMKAITPYEKIFDNYSLPFDDMTSVMGWVAHNKKSLLILDTRETKLHTILPNERAAMVVPLIVENEVMGAIYLGHAHENYFKDEDLGLLRNVAYLSAMSIRNAELYERTATMAITDGLTSLYTHRYFEERLVEEINEAERYGKSLALVMVDADKFKEYNDTLGHPEGDKVLKEFSKLLQAYTRKSDLVCRIGGDEFTILLKETDKKNATQKAEAIRQAVQNKFFERPVQVTASIGLALYPSDASNKKELIKAADDALYISKKTGRNKISVAKEKTTDTESLEEPE